MQSKVDIKDVVIIFNVVKYMLVQFHAFLNLRIWNSDQNYPIELSFNHKSHFHLNDIVFWTDDTMSVPRP